LTAQKPPFAHLLLLCFALGVFTEPLAVTVSKFSGTAMLSESVVAAPVILTSIACAMILPYFRYRGFARNYSWDIEVITFSFLTNIIGAWLGNKVIGYWIDPGARYLHPFVAVLILVAIARLDSKLQDTGFEMGPIPPVES
jgi:hypothetical protein